MSKHKNRKSSSFSGVSNMPVADHGDAVKCSGNEECLYCQISTQAYYFEQDLIGKVLTVLDSALSDDRQNKAVKDLVKGFIFQINWDMRKVINQMIQRHLNGDKRSGLLAQSVPPPPVE